MRSILKVHQIEKGIFKMKKAKSLLALVLALMLVFALAGCGSPETKAEEAVGSILTAFRDADFEKIAEYTGGDVSELTDEQKDLIGGMLEKMEYKIVSSEAIDDGNVNVTVEITSVDVEELLTAVLSKAMEFAMTDEGLQMTEEEAEEKTMEIFEECLNAEDVKTATTEVEVEVKIDGDEWEIEDITGLTKGVLAGMENLGL